MKIYISEQAPYHITDKIKIYGEIVYLPPFEKLSSPVASHADMLMFYSHPQSKTVMPKEYYENNKGLFYDIDALLALEEFEKEYPYDIRLDGCQVGKYLFCNEQFTSEQIKFGYEVINVKQGYAGCSVICLKGEGIISADGGICKKGKNLGLDVLQISQGGVCLPGYSYGFIGGASLVIENSVLFFGDITKHPDCKEIETFIKKHGMSVVNTESFPLTDFGSAFYEKKH